MMHKLTIDFITIFWHEPFKLFRKHNFVEILESGSKQDGSMRINQNESSVPDPDQMTWLHNTIFILFIKKGREISYFCLRPEDFIKAAASFLVRNLIKAAASHLLFKTDERPEKTALFISHIF